MTLDDTDLLRLRAASGAPVADIADLPDRVRRAVAVATQVGAPLLDVLDAALSAQADVQQARRAVTVASAQARTVATGLVVAPALLLPFVSRVTGADPWAFYVTPAGRLVAVLGFGLLVVGVALVAVLVRRSGRTPTSESSALVPGVLAGTALWLSVGPWVGVVGGIVVGAVAARRRQGPVDVGGDEAVDLVATALAGGCGPATSLRMAADHLDGDATWLRRLALDLDLGCMVAPSLASHGLRAGAPPAAPSSRRTHAMPAPAATPAERVARVLADANRLGAPAEAALRRLASQLRADELARVLADAERLPAQLTFPTALCLLPATLLLVGAPIVHSGLAAVGT
ncbi:MAG: hypothetical protein WD575_00565 [Nitriliruptoraceae bacterium]